MKELSIDNPKKTANQKWRVLLIEDNLLDAEWVRRALVQDEKKQFELEWVERLSAGLERLAKGGIDLVLLDLKLPDGFGLEVFDKTHSIVPHLPTIIMTGTIEEEEIALEAIERGAQDYLSKRQRDPRTFIRSLQYAIERKRAEKIILEATRIKDDFTAMVSHELRTPLAVIKEGLDIVVDKTAGPLNADQQKYLQIVNRNVDRLGRLINDVLDYQKLESGHTDFNMALQNITLLVQETVQGFLPVAKKKGLELTAVYQKDLPKAMCDKDKITQVLINLINNAVKFTSQGGVKLTTDSGDNWIRISVHDTGAGIKAEDRSKLFQSFSQLSTGGARKTGGTGLGLAISKEIVAKHHGRIEVDSIYGKGSTFHLILPIADRRKHSG